MNTPHQVSRLWTRRYGRPRAVDGTFAPGYFLWSRPDGQSRWLYYPESGSEDLWQYRWLSDEGRRVFRDLFLIAVVVLLIWFWP